jgi:putative endonuclease
MFEVYILRSQSTGRLYTGFSADPDQRLGQHNLGLSKSTKNRGPWMIVHRESYATRSEAMQREEYLKSGKGREELNALLAGKTVDAD